MDHKKVLVVDDEKNIRLTVAMSLEKLELEVENAVNGEEALDKLHREDYQLVLLDLKLPGMDGVEVLRQLRGFNRKVKVLIITAHGTVENAVEAMKLGAVDFIQKPFTPDEIRGFVSNALSRTADFQARVPQDRGPEVEKRVESLLAGEPARPAAAAAPQAAPGPDYAACIQQAKAAVESYDFASAASWAQAAVAQDTSRPEAFNLLGVLLERRGERLEAQRYYRAALALDPTYKPAWSNLNRSTQNWPQGGIDLGDGPQTAKKKPR